MPTIHPRPKLAPLRSDGFDGLDLAVTLPDGSFWVWPLKPSEAARWQMLLAEWTSQKLKTLDTRE